MTIDRSRRHPRAVSVAGWVAVGAVALGWWLWLAPTAVGGPATYVMVTGHSMEPMLHTGDLVVARRQRGYQLNDLVVYGVGKGHVIHQLVAKRDAGWDTKGINNDWIDPWTVTDSDIAGKYWYSVAGFSPKLQWPRRHPIAFGLLCATIAGLSYIPRRRRRISAELRAALDEASPEPPVPGPGRGEGALLGVALLGCLFSAISMSNVLATRVLMTPSGMIAAVAAAVSVGLASYLARRRWDGVGSGEPLKSLRTLKGSLQRIDHLPDLPSDTPVVWVRSAAELALIAQKYRLPVLHFIAPASGEHTFLVVTATRGSYCWTVVESEGDRAATSTAAEV